MYVAFLCLSPLPVTPTVSSRFFPTRSATFTLELLGVVTAEFVGPVAEVVHSQVQVTVAGREVGEEEVRRLKIQKFLMLSLLRLSLTP